MIATLDSGAARTSARHHCHGLLFIARRIISAQPQFTLAAFFALAALSAAGPAFAVVPPLPIEWARQLGSNSYDEGRAVGVDGLGHVYVTGRTLGALAGPNPNNADDAFLAKYDSLGNQIWIRQFGTIFQNEPANGVAVDALGYSYIVGSTDGEFAGPNNFFNNAYVARVDPAGNLMWVQQLGTPQTDLGADVAIDELGNAIITGHTLGDLAIPPSGRTNNFDGFVAKYNSAGQLLWKSQFGTDGFDSSWEVEADSSGNTYVTGQISGATGPHTDGSEEGTFLLKYDVAGQLAWSRQLLGTMSADGLDVDAMGNVYVAGAHNPASAQVTVTKFDSAGNVAWSREFGGAFRDLAFDLVVDSHGNSYVGGAVSGMPAMSPTGTSQLFVAKVSSAGDLLWNEQFGTNKSDILIGLALKGDDSLYATGTTEGALGGPNVFYFDAFLVKFAGVPEPKATLLGAWAALAIAWGHRRRGVRE